MHRLVYLPSRWLKVNLIGLGKNRPAGGVIPEKENIMSKMIIVKDSGIIRDVATSHGDKPANAYAAFGYGDNGRTRQEAMSEAEAAQKQKAREEREYGR